MDKPPYFKVLCHATDRVKYINWFKLDEKYDLTLTWTSEGDQHVNFVPKGQKISVQANNYLVIAGWKVATNIDPAPTVVEYKGTITEEGKTYLSFTQIPSSGGRKRKYKTRRTRRTHNKTVIVKRTTRHKRK